MPHIVVRHLMSTLNRLPSSPLRFALIATLCILMVACSSTAPIQQPVPEAEAEPTTEAAARPTRPFPPDVLYGLLLGEFAAHRGALDIALKNYLEQALAARDPELAAHATRMARYLGDQSSTLQAATLWAELDPHNTEARLTAATALAHDGHPQEALRQMLLVTDEDAPTNFSGIAASALELEQQERENMLRALEQRPHQSHDVLIASGLLLQSLDRNDEALEHAERVLADEPDNLQALLLGAQACHNMDKPEAGNALIERALERRPDDRLLRMQYARLLARSDQQAAQRQLRILIEQNPADGEARLALALVYRESDQFDHMREQLDALLADGNQVSAAHFYLAQDAERREDADDAIRHYLQIRPGPVFQGALMRAADLILQTQGREALADAFVGLRQRWPAQAMALTVLEAELRIGRDDLDGAKQLLDATLAEHPDEAPLLYVRSLVAERRRDIPALERDLRHMLKLNPQNPLALNALGYSLANLTDRYAEALALIEQALALQPDDPAIIDSMGWVLYRLGQYDEALTHLRQAFEAYPDHEVAAHLGEVLWVRGEQNEARAVWEKGLESTPDSRVISETMHRLGATAAP